MHNATNFQSREDQLLCIDNAIDAARSRADKSINTKLSGMYSSLLNQLQYVKHCIEDAGIDRSRLHDISVGHIAIREFEESDPEFAATLKRAYFICYYKSQGLKVPCIDESGNII
jgi:hypothetical protein